MQLEGAQPQQGNRENQVGSFAVSTHTGLEARPQEYRAIPPKLYRIGEIVDFAGVSRQTIHNYTIMGLISESRRTSGGHRVYGASVFERLSIIAEMKRQRRSLRDIQERLAQLQATKQA